jgi:hypothetical protein
VRPQEAARRPPGPAARIASAASYPGAALEVGLDLHEPPRSRGPPLRLVLIFMPCRLLASVAADSGSAFEVGLDLHPLRIRGPPLRLVLIFMCGLHSGGLRDGLSRRVSARGRRPPRGPRDGPAIPPSVGLIRAHHDVRCSFGLGHAGVRYTRVCSAASPAASRRDSASGATAGAAHTRGAVTGPCESVPCLRRAVHKVPLVQPGSPCRASERTSRPRTRRHL